jgi:Tfp pilus assembly protein PilN
MALTQLNFVQGRQAARGWRLALLAAGLLAFGAAGADWLLQARRAGALDAQLAQLAPRPAPQPRLPEAEQRAQERQLAIIGDAVRQLNLPVGRLVKAVQAPADIHVALLGMDLDSKPESGNQRGNQRGSAAGGLKIAAEAETAGDMMRYVAYLNEQDLFTSVYLVKHELNGAAANRPYRFQLEAQWQD